MTAESKEIIKQEKMIPIVLAYKRPELTSRLVARLLEIDSKYESIYGSSAFSSILLVHDGLRRAENKESQGIHQYTRDLCFDLERANTKIRRIVFNSNLGLTQHIFRIVDGLDFSLSNYIFLKRIKLQFCKELYF